MINFFARVLSVILSPLILPTYGMIIALWTSSLSTIPTINRIAVTIMVFLFTNLLPAAIIALLMRMKVITSWALPSKKERNIPFIVAILCYVSCTIYLANIMAPLWLLMFLIAATLTAITCGIINLWWKISFHCAATAGVLGLALHIFATSINTCNMLPVISIAILSLGAIASARLFLERHTLAQVIAGSIVGFLWVYLLT